MARAGIQAAFAKTNAAGGVLGTGATLELVSLDDMGQDSKRLNNTQVLLGTLGTLGLVGYTGEGLRDVLSVLSDDVPFISPISGAAELRTPFAAQIINIRASYFEEMQQLVTWAIANDRQRIGVVYQESENAEAMLEALESAMRLYGMRTKGNVSLSENASNNDILAAAIKMMNQTTARVIRPPTVIVVLAETLLAGRIIDTFKSLFPTSWYFATCMVEPLSLLNNMGSPANVYISSVAPPVFSNMSVSTSPRYAIEQEFTNAIGAYNWAWNVHGLEGYLAGAFVNKVLENVAGGNVTRQSILYTIYNMQMITISGLRLGLYCNDDTCASSCNQGMRRVYILALAASPKAMRQVKEAPFASCGIAPVLTQAPIVFGVSTVLRAHHLGIRAAFEQVNKNGGVNGRTVHTLMYDDSYITGNAVFNAQELINDDGVFSLAGFIGTEIGAKIVAALDDINANRKDDPIAFVGPYTGGQELRVPARKYVINIRGSYYDEMETSVAYLASMGVDLTRTVALVQDDNFGSDCLAGVNLALQKRGIDKVAAYATYSKLANDVNPAVAALNTTTPIPSTVFFCAIAAPSSVFMRALYPLWGPNTYWMSTGAGSTGYTGINNITQRLFASQVVPLPRGSIRDAFLDSYQDALTNLFKQPTYASQAQDATERDAMTGLEGYVVGNMIINAMQRISLGEKVSRSVFLNIFYTTGSFNLGSTMVVGPWSETCQAGLVTMFLTNVTKALTFEQVPHATRTILRVCTPAPAIYIYGETVTKTNSDIAIGVSVAMVLVLIAIIIVAVVVYRRKRLRYVIDTKGKGIIQFHELTFKKSVGMGSFGEVFLGDWAGSEVAIKKLIKNEMTPKQLKEFVGETALMFELRHPNIVLFMGVCTEVPNLCMVTEFMHRGSLFDNLHKNYIIEQPMMLKFARDVCSGLAYLHQRNVTHRDMKSLNVLVSRDWTAKVSDFGMSQLKDSEQEEDEKLGTVLWSPPETLRQEKATKKSDIYSFGVILWEIYTRRVPWDGVNQHAVTVKVLAGQTLPREASFPAGIDTLMVSCWSKSADDRPTAAEIQLQLEAMEDPHGQLSLPVLADAPPQVNNPLSGAQVFIPNLPVHYTDHPIAIDAAIRSIERVVTQIRKECNGFEVLADGETFRFLFHGPRFTMTFCNRVREELARIPWNPEGSIKPRSSASLLHEQPNALGTEIPLAEKRETVRSENPQSEAPHSARTSPNGGSPLALANSLAGIIALSAHYARATLVSEGPQKGTYGGSILTGLESLKSKVPAGGAYATVDLLKEAPEQEVYSDDAIILRHGAGEVFVRAFLPGTAITGGASLPGTMPDETVPEPASAWFARQSHVVIQSGPDDRIGIGTYSIAMKATWRGDSIVFKKLINQNLSVEQLLDMRLEAAVLRHLVHPNLVMIKAACTFTPKAGFIVPLVARGNLHEMLMPKSPSRAELTTHRLAIARGVGAGLAYLHQHNVIHGSLKTANVLIDRDWSVRLSDFGFGKLKLSMATMTNCDKAIWMSPEIAQGAATSLPGDVFCFAMILWSLCQMGEPFQNENGFAALVKVLKGTRPDISTKFHPEIAALIMTCWDQSPEKRPLMSSAAARLNEAPSLDSA